jgi:hypothetical protein
LARDHLVEIQDDAGGGGVSREFGGVDRLVARGLAGSQQLFCGRGIGAILS